MKSLRPFPVHDDMEQIGKYEVRKKLGEGATSEVYFSPKLVAALEASISDAAGPFRLERATPAAGGCIHRSYVLEGGGRKFFSKIDERSQSDSFAAESDSLEALAAAGIRVPAPLGRGETRKDAFLVLEYLELHGNGDYSALGRALAAVHSVQREDYGWH
ncbi:MAG TPA: fructosamine kinase family protein, partial [Burkholderiales bacterium]|nr:fructosamine kinase family protein [Burkholderiales bacterium]